MNVNLIVRHDFAVSFYDRCFYVATVFFSSLIFRWIYLHKHTHTQVQVHTHMHMHMRARVSTCNNCSVSNVKAICKRQ